MPYRDSQGRVIGVLGIFEDITERKRAEERLRESEEKHRYLVENINEIVYEFNSRGCFTYISPRLRDLVEYEPNDIIGRTCKTFVHPEDWEEMTNRWAELNKGVEDEVDFRIITKSDKTKWVRTQVKTFWKETTFLGGRGTFIDITERKRAEEALCRAQVFTNTLLENLLEGVVACDADGVIVLFNKMSREWHGLDPIAIPQEQWADYYDLYCADGVTPMTVETLPLSRAFRGDELRNEYLVIRAKGQTDRHIVANCAPFFDEKGSKLGAMVVMHDITDRKW